MALAYIALALVMLAMHLEHVPAAFLLFVRSAFGLQPAIVGVSGGIAAAMLDGVKRRLFSNEAGMGQRAHHRDRCPSSDPRLHSSAGRIHRHDHRMFHDCIIILVSGLYDPSQPAAIAGAPLTQAAIAH
jgi:alanine or glycine:cation symporter, AGCS family